MQDTKLAVPVTPEIGLALEAGFKEALKDVVGADEDGGLRAKVSPDQKLKGVKIDLTLTIGEVMIGHDTDKAATASIPTLPALALVLKRSGATKDASIALLRDVIGEAMKLDKKATEALLEQEGVAEVIEEIKKEVVAKLPRVPVAKSIKAKDAKIVVTGVSQTS